MRYTILTDNGRWLFDQGEGFGGDTVLPLSAVHVQATGKGSAMNYLNASSAHVEQFNAHMLLPGDRKGRIEKIYCALYVRKIG